MKKICGIEEIKTDYRLHYFVFTLPAELVDELPQQLISQTGSIERKVIRRIIEENE